MQWQGATISVVPVNAVSLVPSRTGTGKLPRGSKSVAILDWLVGSRGDVSGSSSMAASSSSCEGFPSRSVSQSGTVEGEKGWPIICELVRLWNARSRMWGGG